MEIETLSNLELKQSLESLGFNCGPVTTTTRALYEKKLANLMSEGEVVQSRQSFSEKVTVSQKNTEVTQKAKEAIEEVDYPFSRGSFSSPRSYTPDGSNLTRRPLSTPHRNTTRVSSIAKTSTTISQSSTSKSEKKSKSILGYCKYVLPVFILVALLIILVYYHMEDGGIKELGQK